MPRKRTTDDGRIQVAVRLPADLLARLDEEAERRVLGRNKLVELAIGRALNEWEKDGL